MLALFIIELWSFHVHRVMVILIKPHRIGTNAAHRGALITRCLSSSVGLDCKINSIL